MIGVGAAPAVLDWPEEKEGSDPGQVYDGSLAVCSTLLGYVEGLEGRDEDWEDSGSQRVLLHICCELSSQAKVKLAQLVLPGVAVPHGCIYMPYGMKVLFYGPLLDRDLAGFQKSGVHALGKNLEERGEIPDTLELGWDSKTFSELAPLAPGSGFFLEGGG